jgi:hypothetical protein
MLVGNENDTGAFQRAKPMFCDEGPIKCGRLLLMETLQLGTTTTDYNAERNIDTGFFIGHAFNVVNSVVCDSGSFMISGT